MLNLSYSLTFSDLNSNDGLHKINQEFSNFLLNENRELFFEYSNAKINDSNLIIKLAPYLEKFISKLFNIEEAVEILNQEHKKAKIIATIKREFVQRRAIIKYKNINENLSELKQELVKLIGEFNEYLFAESVQKWLEQNDEEKLDIAAKYASVATLTQEGKKNHQNGTLFHLPTKIDENNLVNFTSHEEKAKARNSFKLSDKGRDLQYAIDQANYCILCHHQQKDSCSHGLKDKNNEVKTSAQNIKLEGCPLEEKISEMNEVKLNGFAIGTLAIAIIDNPMIAATGHRICNDCMKSCIYQKQEPVNIPQIETRILKDVLELPWGFEIYSLLTRWNPLNFTNILPKHPSGHNILVVGMGPSGFTLAHYLLNSGHNVVAIDGLKIEPLLEIYKNSPIKDVNTLFEELDDRIIGGFGGVTEYGITIRWNKNYLKLIRILLERRKNFSVFGGIRFGSNINPDQAFKLGFEHIALCIGAGKPNLLDIPNALAKGVRTASDFLMSLQLGGAFKKDSLANLQIRLPLIVIGGGLTALDTATEALSYYPLQVEKFLTRIEKIGLDKLNLNEEEKEIANEFITHAKEIREENKKDHPNILRMLKKWGGVKILYRKDIENSPSYRLNHEEIAKALEEGIMFVNNVVPQKIVLDKFNHAKEIIVKHNISEMEIKYPAKTILIALGTSPNTVLREEFPDFFELDGRYFKKNNSTISFFGDLHPKFYGNVVKAMASAKYGYPEINEALKNIEPKNNNNFLNEISNKLIARIKKIDRLSSNIIEIFIEAPLACENFSPGQFYRLQNFATCSNFAMEGIAATGASVDKSNGIISTIILEMGGSSSLCQYLKEGEQVILMGPTGTPTEIPQEKSVMLIGGGVGNAVLFSIGKACKEAGSKVIYFAGYRKIADICKIDELEKAADQIIYCCEETGFMPKREQDRIYSGNIVEAIEHYAKSGEYSLLKIDNIIVIGSDRMMKAVNTALAVNLKKYFSPNVKSIASINSPMQCMMKEICAQCLQKHINKETGKEYYVYS